MVAIFYIIFSAINDIKEWKQNEHYFNIPVSAYLTVIAVGIGVEGIFPNVPIVQMACSISITLMYIRIVKRIGYIDNLSGLGTRSSLVRYVNNQLSKLNSGEMLAGIMLDVNRFKYINDTFGHIAGDRAVSNIGSIIKAVTKKSGMCFRYGGDEFIIITKVTSTDQIEDLMNRIDLATDQFNAEKKEAFELSVAKGYSIFDTDNASIVKFIDLMDAEMYRNKHPSRNE